MIYDRTFLRHFGEGHIFSILTLESSQMDKPSSRYLNQPNPIAAQATGGSCANKALPRKL